MKRERVIFIAGPYRGKTHYETKLNILAAEEAATRCWQKGWAVICPHTNSSWLSGAAPEEKFLAGYLELMRRSDAVLALNGWNGSEGACIEVLEAQRAEIPVFYGAIPDPEEVTWPQKDKST